MYNTGNRPSVHTHASFDSHSSDTSTGYSEIPLTPTSGQRSNAVLSNQSVLSPSASLFSTPSSSRRKTRDADASLQERLVTPDATARNRAASLEDASGSYRRIYPNQRRDSEEFCSNKIVTSKYTPLTFVPRFLVEQFTRFANAYFLVICILQFFPAVSITGGIPTQALPLTLVLVFDGLITAREDYKRHQDDKLNNNRTTLTMRNGNFIPVAWEDITVGDILKIERNQAIPADCVFLSGHAAEFDGRDTCYVETSQLDGETNLKLRQAVAASASYFRDDQRCAQFRGCIECEAPNASFDKFVGMLEMRQRDSLFLNVSDASGGRSDVPWTQPSTYGRPISSSTQIELPVRHPQPPKRANNVKDGTEFLGHPPIALEAEQTLLRGCVIRNVDYVYAVVVYTGDDTKARVKQTLVSRKRAQTEEASNKLVAGIATMLLVICMMGAAGNAIWTNDILDTVPALGRVLRLPRITFGAWIQKTLTFFLLNAAFIPISLYVTMRLARVFQMTIMQRDEEMQHYVVEPGVTPVHSSEMSTESPESTSTSSTSTPMSNLNETRRQSLHRTQVSSATTKNKNNQSKMDPSSTEPYQIPFRVRSMELNDDLGQITHIFSDKTGTMTMNYMDFRKFCTNGIQYGIGSTTIGIARLRREGNLEEAAEAEALLEAQTRLREIDCAHSISFTPHINFMDGLSLDHETGCMEADARDVRLTAAMERIHSPDEDAEHASTITSPQSLPDHRKRSVDVSLPDPYTSLNSSDTTSNRRIPEHVTAWGQGDHLHELMLHFSLNHTVLPEILRNDSGAIIGKRFSASSPDEEAFVYAAQHFGYSFLRRANDSVVLEIPERGQLRIPSCSQPSTLMQSAANATVSSSDLSRSLSHSSRRNLIRASTHTSESSIRSVRAFPKRQHSASFHARDPPTQQSSGHQATFKILHLLEYTQERKRMSVVVRHPNGRITLYCKGADSVIMPRLRTPQTSFENAVREETDAYLTEWGNDGLRTLCFAFKDLSQDMFSKWSKSYTMACQDIRQRSLMKQKEPNNIERLMDEIENDLILQGATANEDKLQSQVPETIALLAQAGVRVWMLTGDKQETAINIGYATQLLDDDMRQLVATASAAGSAKAGAEIVREAARQLRRGRHRRQWKRKQKIWFGLVDPAAITNAMESMMAKFQPSKHNEDGTDEDTYAPIPENRTTSSHSIHTVSQEDDPSRLVYSTTEKTDDSSYQISRVGLTNASVGINRATESSVNIQQAEGVTHPKRRLQRRLSNVETPAIALIVDDQVLDELLGTCIEVDSAAAPSSTSRHRSSLASASGPVGFGPYDQRSISAMDREASKSAREEYANLSPSHQAALDLLEVAAAARSVICCRARPDQKAAMVQLVRSAVPGSRTLAIGDGANDVNMIKAAHVGVGISGKEGVQASNASDYSFGQFQFLQRLLLIHGRWNYRRMSKLVLYTFYKNIIFVLTQFWYSAYNGWSGQKFYVEYATQTYNLLYTGLPIILMAILDRDVDAKTTLLFPELYRESQGGSWLNGRRFLGWAFAAITESAIIFFTAAYGFTTPSSSDGSSPFVFCLGVVCFTSVVIVVNLRLATEVCLHHWLIQAAFLGSVALWIPMCYLFGSWEQDGVPVEGYNFVFGSASFYLCVIFVSILILIRLFLWRAYKRLLVPTLRHVVQEASIVANSTVALRQKIDVLKATDPNLFGLHGFDRFDIKTALLLPGHGATLGVPQRAKDKAFSFTRRGRTGRTNNGPLNTITEVLYVAASNIADAAVAARDNIATHATKAWISATRRAKTSDSHIEQNESIQYGSEENEAEYDAMQAAATSAPLGPYRPPETTSQGAERFDVMRSISTGALSSTTRWDVLRLESEKGDDVQSSRLGHTATDTITDSTTRPHAQFLTPTKHTTGPYTTSPTAGTRSASHTGFQPNRLRRFGSATDVGRNVGKKQTRYRGAAAMAGDEASGQWMKDRFTRYGVTHGTPAK